MIGKSRRCDRDLAPRSTYCHGYCGSRTAQTGASRWGTRSTIAFWSPRFSWNLQFAWNLPFFYLDDFSRLVSLSGFS